MLGSEQVLRADPMRVGTPRYLRGEGISLDQYEIVWLRIFELLHLPRRDGRCRTIEPRPPMGSNTPRAVLNKGFRP